MFRVLFANFILAPRFASQLVRHCQWTLGRAVLEAMVLVMFFTGFAFWTDILSAR